MSWAQVGHEAGVTMRRRFGQLLHTPQMFTDALERRAHQETSDVLSQLREGVLVLDRDGGVKHVNAAAQEVLDLLGIDASRMHAAIVERGGGDLAPIEDTRLTGAPADDVTIALTTPSDDVRVLSLGTRAIDPEGAAPYGVIVSFADITDRHEAREALRVSEVRHRTIVEALHEGVVLQGSDAQITACNDQAERLLGLTRDQLMGRTSADPRWRAVHDDGTPWPGEQHPGPRALASGRPVGPETMGIHTPDGVLRWLEVFAMPIHEDGVLTGAVGSFVDVTARRAAEVALQRSEAQVRATLEGLTEGVVFYDDALVLRDTNAAGTEILGAGTGTGPSDRAVGTAGIQPVDVDGSPIPPEQWPIAIVNRTGERVQGTILGLSRGGHVERWVLVNAAPLRSADRPDGPWPVVASFTDITERLKRERALVEAEQRVRSTFAAAPIGMRVADPDGTFLEVNTAFADLLGMTVGELIGKTSADVTHPDDLVLQQDGERRVLASELPTFRIEHRFLHAAGHAVWTQLDVTALRDADGVPVATVGQIQDISDRRRHEEQLRHMADHDALTGLLNRRGFQAELERHVQQAERYGSGGALLMVDLDHFKYVNDTLGHKAGDELIVAVADLLRSRLRKTDVIARLGGDEFAVLLPRGSVEEANRAAQSVLRALRERQRELAPMGRLKLSASVGVAALDDASLTADELMINADLAMYDAKEAGRDQVADYAAGRYQQPRIKARMTWMERINAALEHDRFTLFAQPIVDLATDRVAMHELLLRMHGDNGDLVPPATFLYIAERFDLVQDIDRWVIDHACELLRRNAGDPDRGALTINVSAKSLNDPDRLLAHLQAALSRSGARPSDLVIEITETAAVSQIHHARAFAGDLQDLGCRLAIDDFGAGFGSFYYLKHLPFDFLKIDGEFVTHARHSRPDELIVRALRDMAHGLEREVIAEYCADEETLDYLRGEGIDLGQGFHLGRPAPAEDLLLLGV